MLFLSITSWRLWCLFFQIDGYIWYVLARLFLFVLFRIGNTEGQVPKNDNGVYSEIERTRKQILHILEPEGEFLQMWNVMFIVSCVIAVSLDPLFFYLHVINEDRKCLTLDTKLKIIAICLRSITDLIYLLNIILQFLCPYIDEVARKRGETKVIMDAWLIAKRYLLSYFLIDIPAILPLPQVREIFLLLNSFCVWFLKFNFNCRNWIRDLTLAKWGSFFWWMLNEDLNPTSIGTNHENFNGVLKKKKKNRDSIYFAFLFIFIFLTCRLYLPVKRYQINNLWKKCVK